MNYFELENNFYLTVNFTYIKNIFFKLRAISNALSRRIEVVQPNGCVILFGDDFTLHKPLVVTYHRFAYTLGEHYNSTVSFPIGDVSVNA